MTTKDQLYAVLSSLSDMEAAYKNDEVDKRAIWSYGAASIASSDWTVSEELVGEEIISTSTADVAITDVNPILSRVDFTVDPTNATGWVSSYDDERSARLSKENYVILKGVAVLYSASNAHYIPEFTPTLAKLGSADALVSGLVPAEGTEWYLTPRPAAAQYGTADTETFLHATWDGNWNSNANVKDDVFSRSFYALAPNDVYAGANASLKAKPIITAYAERYVYDENLNGGNGDYKEPELIFWPIQFDGETVYGSKTLTMENGVRYKINATLNGDLADDDNSFTPETRYVADVTVTVSQAKWKTPVEISHDFNAE